MPSETPSRQGSPDNSSCSDDISIVTDNEFFSGASRNSTSVESTWNTCDIYKCHKHWYDDVIIVCNSIQEQFDVVSSMPRIVLFKLARQNLKDPMPCSYNGHTSKDPMPSSYNGHFLKDHTPINGNGLNNDGLVFSSTRTRSQTMKDSNDSLNAGIRVTGFTPSPKDNDNDSPSASDDESFTFTHSLPRNEEENVVEAGDGTPTTTGSLQRDNDEANVTGANDGTPTPFPQAVPVKIIPSGSSPNPGGGGGNDDGDDDPPDPSGNGNNSNNNLPRGSPRTTNTVPPPAPSPQMMIAKAIPSPRPPEIKNNKMKFQDVFAYAEQAQNFLTRLTGNREDMFIANHISDMKVIQHIKRGYALYLDRMAKEDGHSTLPKLSFEEDLECVITEKRFLKLTIDEITKAMCESSRLNFTSNDDVIVSYVNNLNNKVDMSKPTTDIVLKYVTEVKDLLTQFKHYLGYEISEASQHILIKIVRNMLKDGQNDITSFWTRKILECEASFRSVGKEVNTKTNFTHFLYVLHRCARNAQNIQTEARNMPSKSPPVPISGQGGKGNRNGNSVNAAGNGNSGNAANDGNQQRISKYGCFNCGKANTWSNHTDCKIGRSGTPSPQGIAAKAKFNKDKADRIKKLQAVQAAGNGGNGNDNSGGNGNDNSGGNNGGNSGRRRGNSTDSKAVGFNVSSQLATIMSSRPADKQFNIVTPKSNPSGPTQLDLKSCDITSDTSSSNINNWFMYELNMGDKPALPLQNITPFANTQSVISNNFVPDENNGNGTNEYVYEASISNTTGPNSHDDKPSLKANILFDTGAMNGNWVPQKIVNDLSCHIYDTTPTVYSSPLDPKTSYTSNTLVLLDIHISKLNMSYYKVQFRILPNTSGNTQHIIIGSDTISTRDIKLFLVSPELTILPDVQIAAEDSPKAIPTSKLNSMGSILDLTGPEQATSATIESFNWNGTVDKDFPLRSELIDILKGFDEQVFVYNLHPGVHVACDKYKPKLLPNEIFDGVKYRPINGSERLTALKNWLTRALENGTVVRSSSKTTSPLVLVKKKDSPTPYRVTQDCTDLNSKLETLHGYIPITREHLQQLGSHEYYSSFDMQDCYYQFAMHEDVRSLFAFSTPFGTFEYTGITQGEKGAPFFIHSILTSIFAEHVDTFIYFDDITLTADSPQEVLDNTKIFLERCAKFNIKLSKQKLLKHPIASKEINVVGYKLSKAGFMHDDAQREKFLKAPFPTITTLKSWLGLLNVFRDYIKDVYKIEDTFKAARKKDAIHLEQTPEMLQAFHDARAGIANIELLEFPRDGVPIVIEVDASNTGTGAFLFHEIVTPDENNLPVTTKIPLRFTSHLFSDTAEMDWVTIDKEAYGIYHAIASNEALLLGHELIIRTDHKNLTYMANSRNARVRRYYQYLDNFDYQIDHVKGSSHQPADAISRILLATIFPMLAQLTPDPEVQLDDEATAIEPFRMNAKIQDQIERIKEAFDNIHCGYLGHRNIRDTIDLIHKEIGKVNPNLLKHQVLSLMSSCPGCVKKRKLKSNSIFEYHTTSSFTPFESFQVDYLTGLPTSSTGACKLLIFTCSFSRFTYLYPCNDETAQSTINGLLQLTGIFGSPRNLVSDGGPAFISEGFEEFCKLLGIDTMVTAPYRPTGHGIVERQIKETLDKAKSVFIDYADANAGNWHTYIPLVNRILNAHIHSAIGCTPYEVIFGTKQATDRKMLHEQLPYVHERYLNFEKNWNPGAYVRDLQNALDTIGDHALLNLQETLMQNHDKAPETTTTYSAGDYVLYRNFRTSTRKLKKFSPNLIGPLRVVSRLIGDFYELKDVVQDVPMFAHAADISLYNCSSDEEARKIACSDHDEFVVDKVTAHVTDPTLLFKVHYKDNNNSFSWLPFRDVKYLEQAKSYADKNKKDFDELRKLKWPDPNAATIGKRAKKGRGHTGSGYADMG